MGKLPLVCIVIVNWNGGQTIKNCLISLKKTKYSPYKVVLVDNGSTDNSVKELLKIMPEMEVIYLPKNYGYTVGTNIGWRYSLKKYSAKYICAMDSDIVTIDPNWLKTQINTLEKSKYYGISCSKLIFPDGRLQLLYLERPRKEYNEKDTGQYDFVKEVSAVGGACIIIKNSLIKKMGYYDENFFYGPNDIDYCLRAGKIGFKTIYNGKAKAIHIGSFSYKSTRKDFLYGEQCYGQLVFYFRHQSVREKIQMIMRQFIRAFITRKDPFAKQAINNTYFHLSFPIRLFYFTKSLISAIHNYKKIKYETSESLEYQK